MNYGITGWSGGPRQSLTHNLKAGQFRGMGRVSIFPSNTTIINNNNFGTGFGMYDDCCCNNSNSTPSWMNWMMGIGLGGTLLGNIIGMFTGGNKTEGAGEAKTEAPKQDKAAKTDEFADLKTGYPEGKFFKVGDKYCCRLGDDVYEADSLEDLNTQLKNAIKKPATEPKTEKKEEAQEEEPATSTLPKLFNDMSGFKTEADVTAKFKELTGADAAKIDDLKGDITLAAVKDTGNGTTKSGTLKLNSSLLKGIKQGESKTLGKFQGKAVTAENLDGYIRIKVGEQTYIVGQQGDKYTGYQYKDGNVIGYDEYNWRNKH